MERQEKQSEFSTSYLQATLYPHIFIYRNFLEPHGVGMIPFTRLGNAAHKILVMSPGYKACKWYHLVSNRSLSGSQPTWPSYTAEALLELIWIVFGNCGINTSSWARRSTASSWVRLACFLLGVGIPAWVPLALIPGRRFSRWKGGWGSVCAKGPGSFLRERALTATVLRARARARGERHHSELSSSSIPCGLKCEPWVLKLE